MSVDKPPVGPAIAGVGEQENAVGDELKNLLGQLDRELLKKLYQETSGGQKYYGRDFELKDDDRAQLKVVAAIIKNRLAGKKQESGWQELQRLIAEGAAKGVLMSFKPGVPGWLLDRGLNAQVKKLKMLDGRAGIQVPTELYNLYYWNRLADELEAEAGKSNNLLGGTSVAHLNEMIQRASYYFKEIGLIQ